MKKLTRDDLTVSQAESALLICGACRFKSRFSGLILVEIASSGSRRFAFIVSLVVCSTDCHLSS